MTNKLCKNSIFEQELQDTCTLFLSMCLLRYKVILTFLLLLLFLTGYALRPTNNYGQTEAGTHSVISYERLRANRVLRKDLTNIH